MRFFLATLLALGFLVVPAVSARAELQGTAELSYAQYKRQEGGQTTVDANHFSQQYSLLWSERGLIEGGRGGRYELAVGGEFNALKSKVNDRDISLDSTKVLYNGDVLIAPGGLPFRLHLYSYDLHRTTFLDDSVNPLDRQTLLQPNISTDFNNGQHYVTGATLLLGIRNGSYLGRYRDILSMFPRILLDYREVYVRDMKALQPAHYRDRKLAFVSLNKKDNWLHYRVTDYTDYQNHNNDYQTRSWMLGTVDQTLMRRWINMTNWIRVSADGSYTTKDQNLGTQPNEKRYDLNLFSIAQRSSWGVNNFTSLQRIAYSDRIKRQLDIPVFANGLISRDTSWRLRMVGRKEDQSYFDDAVVDQKDDDLYLSGQFTTFQTRPYTLTPKLEAEARDQDITKGQAVRGTLEMASNSLYLPKVSWFASYSLGYFGGEDKSAPVGQRELSAWEQVLTGKAETMLSRRLRSSIQERLIYFDGDANASLSDQIRPEAAGDLVGTTQTTTQVNGKVYRSTSNLRFEYERWRLRNALQVTYDFLHRQGRNDDQWIFQHDLFYSGRTFRARMGNTLTIGQEPGGETFASGNSNNSGSQSLAFQGTADKAWYHFTDIDYSPGRAWQASLRGDYYWRSLANGNAQSLRLRQKFQYNWYTVNGLVRKLVQLEERIESQWDDVPQQPRSHYNEYSLLLDYFPINRILLGARAHYYDYAGGSDGALVWGLISQFNFPKLQLVMTYDAGTADNVDEQRWEVSVRKIF